MDKNELYIKFEEDIKKIYDYSKNCIDDINDFNKNINEAIVLNGTNSSFYSSIKEELGLFRENVRDKILPEIQKQLKG